MSTRVVEVLVGRIGKPHGVRGEVTIDVRTDEPERRFAPGSSVSSPDATYTVERTRWHQGTLLVKFAEASDRNAAEGLRGTLLHVEVPVDASPDDEDEYYDHQLIGLAVEDASGRSLGTVAQVLHGGQDVLVVKRDDGGEGMVPFVRQLVPVVDLPGGRLVVEDRPGLISPFEEE